MMDEEREREYVKAMKDNGRALEWKSKNFDYDPTIFDLTILDNKWREMWKTIYVNREKNKLGYYSLLQMRVDEILKNGDDIDKRIDDKGNTLLMIYASRNDEKAVEYLINNEANLLLENNDNDTAIMLTTSDEIRRYLEMCIDSMYEPVNVFEMARHKNELHPLTGKIFRQAHRRFQKTAINQLKLVNKKPRAKSVSGTRKRSQSILRPHSVSGGRKSNKIV